MRVVVWVGALGVVSLIGCAAPKAPVAAPVAATNVTSAPARETFLELEGAFVATLEGPQPEDMLDRAASELMQTLDAKEQAFNDAPSASRAKSIVPRDNGEPPLVTWGARPVEQDPDQPREKRADDFRR